MSFRRLTTVTCASLLALPLAAACEDDANEETGEEVGGTVSVEALRELAETSGPRSSTQPTQCPLDIDPSAATGSDATFREASAEVAEQTEPAEDPVKAQTEDGLSPLEAAAGASITCTYEIDGRELLVDLVANRAADSAAMMFLPAVQAEADMPLDRVEDFADEIGDPGRVLLADDVAAVVRLRTEDDGDAALHVSGGGLEGDALEDAVRALAEQLTD